MFYFGVWYVLVDYIYFLIINEIIEKFWWHGNTIQYDGWMDWQMDNEWTTDRQTFITYPSVRNIVLKQSPRPL